MKNSAHLNWKSISKDPICSDVRKLLAREIEKSSKGLVYDKHSLLRKRVRDMEVLDIGVVDHCENFMEEKNWLHAKIKVWSKKGRRGRYAS